MNLSPLELADRYSILLIKKMHGLDCGKELKELRKEMQHISSELLAKFVGINRQMWDLEDRITASQDLTEIGRLYLQLRGLTKERAELKRELKNY